MLFHLLSHCRQNVVSGLVENTEQRVWWSGMWAGVVPPARRRESGTRALSTVGYIESANVVLRLRFVRLSLSIVGELQSCPFNRGRVTPTHTRALSTVGNIESANVVLRTRLVRFSLSTVGELYLHPFNRGRVVPAAFQPWETQPGT